VSSHFSSPDNRKPAVPKSNIDGIYFIFFFKEGALGKPQPVRVGKCTVQDAEGRIKTRITKQLLYKPLVFS